MLWSISILLNRQRGGAGMPPKRLTPEQYTRVQNVALAGKKIEAIKLYRELTGAGLKEAKDAVESMNQPKAL
ncbi:MAG TPA: ribosomal protein L7/L12 [Verrucomicrobiae bacterium]